MPFVKQMFHVKQPQNLTLFLRDLFQIRYREAQKLVDTGRVSQGERILRDKKEIIEEAVEVKYFLAKSRGLSPCFQTDRFLLFDKPAGLHVHPQRHGYGYTLLDEIRHHGGRHADPAHRLDRETSGLLLAGRDRKSTGELSQLFETQKVKKTYLALVRGRFKEKRRIELPLRSSDSYAKSKHKTVVDDGGKSSVTIVKPLHYDPVLDQTLVLLHPQTGRTHQLRVHLFHVKHPIVGDPLYGTDFTTADRYLDGKLSGRERLERCGAKRLMLHAYALEFRLDNPFTLFSPTLPFPFPTPQDLSIR